MVHHKYINVDKEFRNKTNLGVVRLRLTFDRDNCVHFNSKVRHYFRQFKMMGNPYTDFFTLTDKRYLGLSQERLDNCDFILFSCEKDSKGCFINLYVQVDWSIHQVPWSLIEYYNLKHKEKLHNETS